MKRFLLLLILALFTAVTAYLVQALDKKNKEIKAVEGELTAVRLQADLLKNIVKAEASQFMLQSRSITGAEESIAALMSTEGHPKLIFRFDKYACETCLDNAIADLEQYREKIGESNILILTSFTVERDWLLLKNRLKGKYQYYNMKSDTWIRYEKEGEHLPPHFFMLTTAMKPAFFFFYTKELPELNKGYFEAVANYIQQSSSNH